MGKASKALQAFIDNIPDSKLTGFPEGAGTIYTDQDFRLDMQGASCEERMLMTKQKTTSGGYNLQIQVNRGTKVTTLKPLAPQTVAGPVIATGTETASVIRANFVATMKI
ncbi:unnamed protein product [Tuber aestivum]|uniref:Uncharacterized protein n=1 Tax=Tuber aestivum TaxID=59557 RepID=A0A292PI38_9PEZI|nr:unnamed protein product [Tuber aestivum]